MPPIQPSHHAPIASDTRAHHRSGGGPAGPARRDERSAEGPSRGPSLSPADAERAAAHAQAEDALLTRERDLRARLGELDRSLTQFSTQSADLSSRASHLLAPASAL